MDKLVVDRIDQLLSHIEMIENDLKDVTLEEMKESSLLTRATAFSLAQIGEQMITLEKYFGKDYPKLPWKNARNMRNIIVHVYNEVNAKVVYSTAKNDLKELKDTFIKIKSSITTEA